MAGLTMVMMRLSLAGCRLKPSVLCICNSLS